MPAGAEPQPVGGQPTAERRLVSVLFADLVGFTSLSEERDPEEVRELLSTYFDACRRVIERFGGTIEKFIGDAVMALWGAPVATEDDAERAVRAALDLVTEIGELGERVGARGLAARAGVATGEAAVTIGAEGQGMVAGDLVNTASRIQSVAEPGAVFVGEATRRATEEAFVYEDAGTFELKGKVGLIPLWRASRVVAGMRGTLKSVGLEPPFVGRNRELRMVKELFHASADERSSHLVSVLGVAGIGKSRLVWEFFKYVDGLAEDTWWHRGRCLSYGEGVTYWALAEMVRMRCRIAEEEAPTSARAKLGETLEQHIGDPDERRWIEPRLAHLLGIEERTAADKEDLFAAWRLFFERLADTYPVVMAFEDMQWADSSLLDFIEYLLEWSRNSRIFVMTLARPELTERRPTWGAGKRNFTSLYLEPLPEKEMHRLLSGLVIGLPRDSQERILERAAGIPLYAVETVRMLLDRGLLVQDGTVYRPTGPIETLEVPETLHALIAARLDGLTVDERRAVQDASVLGKTFFKAGLATVSGLPEEELDPILTSLVRKEVLSLQADPRSPERGQFGFLQDLLRTVAYETLSKKERKAKHLAATGFIERTWAGDEDEIVEVLASHYLQAYEAAPDAADAQDIKTRARDMLRKAGEHAASLAAAGEAHRYFERAAALTEEPLELAELHERAGRMARVAGDLEEAARLLEHAIGTFDSVGLTHPAARVSAALAEILWLRGDIDDAIARMRSALDVLAGEEEDADLATLAAQLGRILYFHGEVDEALERIELALSVAEGLRLPEVLSEALNTKGMILTTHGRYEEGTVLLRRSLEIALEHDLVGAALRATNNLAAQAGMQDRYAEVIELSGRVVELARRVGDRPWELNAVLGDLEERILLGRWDEAETLVMEHIDTDLPVEGLNVAFLNVVPAWIWRGELERARQLLGRFAALGSSGDILIRSIYRRFQASLLRAEGRLRDALEAAQEAFATRVELGVKAASVKAALVEALEAAFSLGDRAKVEELLGFIEGLRPGSLTPAVRAHGARFAARYAATWGDPGAVEPGWEAAAAAFAELSMPFHVAMTKLEHGEWLIAQGRPDEAAPLLAEAREVFEELRAKPWLERADALADRRSTVG
jgi:class 3 adenylate cyclase/tetratricopeptide (TPR) repeat protein